MLSDYARRALDALWTLRADDVVYYEKDSKVVYTARQMYDEILAETPLSQGFLKTWLNVKLI